jgi:CDP-4-dehydro-6-deoxyglucose reductase
MRDATLISARTISPEVREITVDAGADFVFVPGQWVSFRIPHEPEGQLARAYSIASPPRADGRFEIAITRVEGGPGSNFLHEATVGTSLRMTKAEGLFALRPSDGPLLMVATGTGVAPFRSMLLAHDLSGKKLPPSRLLFGMRTERDLIYRDDFSALESRQSLFEYLPTLSRPSESWAGRQGYVQLHVAELVRVLGGDCNVFICGLSAMISAVRKVLKDDLGIARERIHTERYD